MQKLTLADIALATAGTPLRGQQDRVAGNICTDSRSLQSGEFFVPLEGRKFDGHAFLRDAVALGASGCLIRAGWEGRRALLGAAPETFGIVEVANTNIAYAAIAAYYRRLFFDLSVTGVTGSNGKSTTKEMIAALLSSRFRVLKNEGTLNNLVGVPQTLLKLDWQTQIAVLEMGTSMPGEIAALSRVARPDVGVLTNVGPSHLEFFDDLGGVAREKGALAESLNPQGVYVVNQDDARAWATASRTKARVVGFGSGEEAWVRATDAVCDASGHWSFTVCLRATREERRMRLGVMGRHNIANALAAIAVAMHYGMVLDEMQPALEAFVGLKMRMQRTTLGPAEVIHDAYNANPQSFAAALETLTAIHGAQRKILVLGDMLELGACEKQAHDDAGALAAASQIALLVTVGKRAAWSAQSFATLKRAGQETYSFEDADAAGDFLSRRLREGDLVLLKGSRGMRLESILAKAVTACS